MTLSPRFRAARLLPLLALSPFAVLPALPVQASGDPAPITERADRAPVVTVARAQTRPIRQIVPVSGSLVAREEVLVFPHTSGYAITELNAEIGDRVAAGDVLARIDDRTLSLRVTQSEASLASARAALSQAQSQVSATEASLRQSNQVLERVRALRTSGTATQSALDDAEAAQLGAAAAAQSALDGVLAAEAALAQAQAALDLARLDLANAAITAPVAGVVAARNGQIGAIAAASGAPIYQLIEDGEVEVSAEVIETELVLLHPGDPAVVTLAGQTQMSGHVRLIAPVVSPTTRLGEVLIALDSSEGLRPGLYVGGRITVADRTSLAVPVSAVLQDSNGAHVLRVGQDNRLEERAVTTGLAWDGWQEILAGLEPGDRVVARAGAFFAAGDEIAPVEAAPDAQTQDAGTQALTGAGE